MRFVGLEQYFPVTGLVEQWSVFQSGHMDVEFGLQHSAGAVRFRANNFLHSAGGKQHHPTTSEAHQKKQERGYRWEVE